MKTTYATAKSRILSALAAEGWKTAPALKTPYAVSPDGAVKLWLKAQSIHVGESRPESSLWVDTKALAAHAEMSAALAAFLYERGKHFQGSPS